MTTTNLAYKTYATTSRETASDRQIELRIFSSITSRMKSADITKPGGFSELAEAMQDNVRLWNILTVDVLNEKNPLPDETKAYIINLGEFTRQHTFKVLGGEASVDVLIDINKAIIDGLRGILPATEEAA